MLYIIYKDIYQARKTILLYFMIGLVFIMSTIRNDMGIFMSVGFIFMMVYGVTARNEYAEDKNKGYSLLRTLPLKPYKIVMSKYITALLLAIAGMLYYLVLARFTNGKIVFDSTLSLALSVGVSLALIFTGILYTFIFRYGAAKAINLSRLFFFGFFFLPVIISSLAKYIPKPSFIESGKLEMFLESISLDLTGWSFLLLGIAFAIYLLTMLASINQFKKNKIM
ncbi:ABC-2 transporter permease [Proteiniborus sp. MB09-C3]|uniref:ABC-2 transporter permease n=1 Tax=Proteiniborus sp. MB09-C3 TaxID=3050072 RepID=UPI0025559575|nr:ABC-2 transporter permease [Proteiniborus sp. MB09-C3]WIV11498.1 ABC-2 transporter permease [Proteiniborus sp. MB09-C3]